MNESSEGIKLKDFWFWDTIQTPLLGEMIKYELQSWPQSDNIENIQLTDTFIDISPHWGIQMDSKVCISSLFLYIIYMCEFFLLKSVRYF